MTTPPRKRKAKAKPMTVCDGNCYPGWCLSTGMKCGEQRCIKCERLASVQVRTVLWRGAMFSAFTERVPR